MCAELPPPAWALVCITSLPWETDVPFAAQDPGQAICPALRGPEGTLPHQRPSPPSSPQSPASQGPKGTSQGPYTLQTPFSNPQPLSPVSWLASIPVRSLPTRTLLREEAKLLWMGHLGLHKPQTDLGALGLLCTCQGWVLCGPGAVASPLKASGSSSIDWVQLQGPTRGQSSGPPSLPLCGKAGV